MLSRAEVAPNCAGGTPVAVLRKVPASWRGIQLSEGSHLLSLESNRIAALTAPGQLLAESLQARKYSTALLKFLMVS